MSISREGLPIRLNRLRMWAGSRLFSISFLFAPMMKIFDRFATDIDLEDYTR